MTTGSTMVEPECSQFLLESVEVERAAQCFSELRRIKKLPISFSGDEWISHFVFRQCRTLGKKKTHKIVMPFGEQ